jgi:Helix-hairpin-helix motif
LVERRRRVRPLTVLAIVIAAMPWLSLGFLTPIAFTVAAIVRWSWRLGLSATVYLGAVVGMFLLSNTGAEDSIWFGLCVATALFVGGVHAIAVAPLVARGARAPRSADPLATLTHAIREDIEADPLLGAVVERRERRRLAREIVAKDPTLADELGIGQPGRADRFDDGGLIDINRVDAAVLATLPGIDGDMVARIVAARRRLEGMRSTADLVVHADIPPEVADQLADRLIFRPLHDELESTPD